MLWPVTVPSFGDRYTMTGMLLIWTLGDTYEIGFSILIGGVVP